MPSTLDPMKGIILAGGTGSRLWPLTRAVSKQLLPVYDKPLIYYPLSTLMLSGIREILMITTPEDLAAFQRLLGDGSQLGIAITYEVQENPDGIAQAFLIGEKFIGSESIVLILGDNIFYGPGLGRNLSSFKTISGAMIFGVPVIDPERYGVAEILDSQKVISVEEKPLNPKSNLAIAGLYYFDATVTNKAKRLVKSHRNELEIVSVLNQYLSEGTLNITVLNTGTAWMDCGTVQSLNLASEYIRKISTEFNVKIGCVEEIAYRQGWITASQVIEIANNLGSNEYAVYLKSVVEMKLLNAVNEGKMS
jgi:glucose-1-phosphate thymidylyltransferase